MPRIGASKMQLNDSTARMFGVAFAAAFGGSQEPVPAPAQASEAAVVTSYGDVVTADSITLAPTTQEPKAGRKSGKKAAKGADSEGRPTFTGIRRRIVRETHGNGVAFKSLSEGEQARILDLVRAEIRSGAPAQAAPKRKAGKGAGAKTAAVDGEGNPATGNGKAVKQGTKAHPYTGKCAKANATKAANKGKTVYYVDADGKLVKLLAPSKVK